MSVIVPPWQTDVGPEITPGDGATFTVTVIDALPVPQLFVFVYMMVSIPVEAPVKFIYPGPEAETMAFPFVSVQMPPGTVPLYEDVEPVHNGVIPVMGLIGALTNIALVTLLEHHASFTVYFTVAEP